MTASIQRNVQLGFTHQPLQGGLHICQIFGEEEERQDAVLKFLLSGLQSGEQACCFSEKTQEQEVRSFLENSGVSFSEATASEQLTLKGTQETYFENGRFDPDRILQLLCRFYVDAMKRGFSGARVIGEISSDVQNMPGGSRLLEYESKVSVLIRTHPVTAVCQYDACAFDGATILDILKVHPLMIVRGSVIHNPFFIPPEQVFSS